MGKLTQTIPKPMMEVGGKPILQHIIVGLRDQARIREFFIVTGHRAEAIEEYFTDGRPWGVIITYGRQGVPDGTGKAPQLAKKWLGDSPFLLTYGDILIDAAEYGPLARALEGKDGVIALKQVRELEHGGAVLVDEFMRVERIVEKAEPGTVKTPWLNAGIYCFKPTIFKWTEQLQKSPRGEYELTDAINAMAADGFKLVGHPLRGQWADVRDPEILSRLNSSLPRNAA
jgi:NDP-sugar pyrophosphorylase family protein